MSHREKLCAPALTSHIETCHQTFSYAPLIVNHARPIPSANPGGMRAIAEEKIEGAVAERMAVALKQQEELRNAFLERFEKGFGGAKHVLNEKKRQSLMEAFEAEAQNELAELEQQARKEFSEKFSAETSVEAIEDKATRAFEALVKEYGEAAKFPDIPYVQHRKHDQLGLFFSETDCWRSEGLVHQPCGDTFAILPGESLEETNTLITTETNANSATSTTSQSLTMTDGSSETETFSEIYARRVRRETDLEASSSGSFGIGPFKLLNIDLSGTFNSNLNFNKIVERINKSSHEVVKNRYQEVLRDYRNTTSASASTSASTRMSNSFSRNWRNDTDKPLNFIKRRTYCKASVIHRRHNVHLAWSGCLENPAADLCSPANIEEKMADEIARIRDKWSKAQAPSEFGPEPIKKNVCTPYHIRKNNTLGVWYRPSFTYAIPTGWEYVGGSADGHVEASVKVQGDRVESQPSDGATGTVHLSMRTDTRSTNKEVRSKICFDIRPSNARDWYDRVNAWRDQQAGADIDALLNAKKEELNKFLLSDQAKQVVIKAILKKYFGIDGLDDYCKSLRVIYDLFDFDKTCFTLLPSWNATEDGCPSAFPVNLFTARCLTFYVPMMEGREMEALARLAAINAVPWTAQLFGQYLAYINQIDQMRATQFATTFDPTGWDVKFDQPHGGYEMTPYDTANTDWHAEHEGMSRDHLVINAFTINVPTLGYRIDPLPLLCE